MRGGGGESKERKGKEEGEEEKYSYYIKIRWSYWSAES